MICSKQTFDNFEKVIFPQLVETFNKIRGPLGDIELNRIDLIKRGEFNNDSSPMSLLKLFFSSHKPEGATKFSMNDKKL